MKRAVELQNSMLSCPDWPKVAAIMAIFFSKSLLQVTENRYKVIIHDFIK